MLSWCKYKKREEQTWQQYFYIISINLLYMCIHILDEIQTITRFSAINTKYICINDITGTFYENKLCVVFVNLLNSYTKYSHRLKLENDKIFTLFQILLCCSFCCVRTKYLDYCILHAFAIIQKPLTKYLDG